MLEPAAAGYEDVIKRSSAIAQVAQYVIIYKNRSCRVAYTTVDGILGACALQAVVDKLIPTNLRVQARALCKDQIMRIAGILIYQDVADGIVADSHAIGTCSGEDPVEVSVQSSIPIYRIRVDVVFVVS